MPNIAQMKNSKFFTKEDAGKGVLLTIKGCTQQNVAMANAPAELKWCLHFNETDKPMVLASVNAQLIAQFLGSAETDHWIGRKIVAYNDPSIMFQGKITGGIRCRAPRNMPPQNTAPAAAPQAATAAATPNAPLATATADPDEPPCDEV